MRRAALPLTLFEELQIIELQFTLALKEATFSLMLYIAMHWRRSGASEHQDSLWQPACAVKLGCRESMHLQLDRNHLHSCQWSASCYHHVSRQPCCLAQLVT